ncbi:MAG: hypothetical protein KAH20_16610 [Methylococcales bacterium]|nr:hypothetical protein [Methylococcales bacterium]
MTDIFSYKGSRVKIEMNKAKNNAMIIIGREKFNAMLQSEEKQNDNKSKLWKCANTGTVTESPQLMALQIIEYWH